MPHKTPEQRRAYARVRYHKKKEERAKRMAKSIASNPSSLDCILRKSPGRAQRKVKDPSKYADNILAWMEKKGVE